MLPHLARGNQDAPQSPVERNLHMNTAPHRMVHVLQIPSQLFCRDRHTSVYTRPHYRACRTHANCRNACGQRAAGSGQRAAGSGQRAANEYQPPCRIVQTNCVARGKGVCTFCLHFSTGYGGFFSRGVAGERASGTAGRRSSGPEVERADGGSGRLAKSRPPWRAGRVSGQLVGADRCAGVRRYSRAPVKKRRKTMSVAP